MIVGSTFRVKSGRFEGGKFGADCAAAVGVSFDEGCLAIFKKEMVFDSGGSGLIAFK